MRTSAYAFVFIAALAGCTDVHTPLNNDGPFIIADLTIPDAPMHDLAPDDLAMDMAVGDMSEAGVPDLQVDFLPPPPPVDLAGDCGDAGCPAGQRCAGNVCVCDSFSCAGCCLGLTCIATNSQTAGVCGAGGVACKSCGITADGCTDGVCTCGGAAVCGATQHCFGAHCVCDSFGCPNGCCVGTTCVPPGSQSFTTCGGGGDVCGTCAQIGDSCGANGCACGDGGACLPGSVCTAGACN